MKQITIYIRKLLFKFLFEKLLRWQGAVLITGPSVYFYYNNKKPRELVHCLQADSCCRIPYYDAYIIIKRRKNVSLVSSSEE